MKYKKGDIFKIVRPRPEGFLKKGHVITITKLETICGLPLYSTEKDGSFGELYLATRCQHINSNKSKHLLTNIFKDEI